MKFKNTRKTLAAILSVLTMMPNCYQLEPGKTGKAKSSQSKQKAGGDVRFLSKNTTMTTGERIGENLLFSVLALLTGGFLFSKCGGNTSSSLQIDPAKVEKKDYGYVIENSIARVVLFPASASNGEKTVYMMYEIKRPEILACFPTPTTAKILKNYLSPIEFNNTYLRKRIADCKNKFASLILHLTGVPHEQTSALLNAITTSKTFPTFDSSPLSKINSDNVLDALRVAITFEFGSSISEVCAWYTKQLAVLKEPAPPNTCELLDTLDELPYYHEDELTACPPCEFEYPLLHADPLERSISNILVDHKPCVFSPRLYFLISSSLRRLNSFAHILTDKERCEKVQKVLNNAKKRAHFVDADAALTATLFSGPTTLYAYIMSTHPKTSIGKIKTDKQKSAHALCTAILETSPQIPQNITCANAATVDTTALNLALGNLALDDYADTISLYTNISEHATAASSRVAASDILTAKFTALNAPLETLRELDDSSASLPSDYSDDLGALTKALTAAQTLLKDLALTPAVDTPRLDDLKTTITSLLAQLPDLKAKTAGYSYGRGIYKKNDPALLSDLKTLNSQFLSEADKLIATKNAIDDALNNGATLINTYASTIQTLNDMRSSLSKLCEKEEKSDTKWQTRFRKRFRKRFRQ